MSNEVSATPLGLVAYYPFSGNANDASANANNGTVNGAVLTADRFGNANSAYSFDGISNWVEIPDDPSLNFGITEGFTIIAWINTAASGPAQRIVTKRPAAESNFYSMEVSSTNNAEIAIATSPINSSLTYVNNTVVNNGTWHMVTGVRNTVTDSLYLYVDSAFSGRSNDITTDLSNSGVLEIGRWGTVSNEYFNGLIDDIRIYNRALSAAEITTLYQEGGWDPDVTPPAAPTGLIATAGDGQVDLSWTANAEADLQHYVVYRSLMDGFTPSSSDSIATVAQPTTNYTSMGLTNGTAYYYKIAAVDNSGNYSPVSAVAGAVPRIADPDITIEPITGDGNVNFAGVGVNMNFTFTNDMGNDVVEAQVFNVAPPGSPPDSVEVLGGRYWQFDHTGSSTFSVDLTLIVGAGTLTAADILNPGLIKLLRRADGSEPDWATWAAGFAATDSGVTFTGVIGFSQYTVARFVPDVVAPDVSPPVASASPSSGNTIEITSTVSDDRAIQSVDMFYMAGGDISFTQVAMTDLGGGSYTASIPLTAVSEAGVAFYVKAIDASANQAFSDTVSASISFTAGILASNKAGSAYPTGIQQEKWRLISLPGNITDRTSATIIGTPMGFSPSDTSWNLFKYTGSGDPPYQPATTLAKGESYFFKQVRLSSVDFIAGAGSSQDVTGYSIPVPAGSWKFFSSPFSFSVTPIVDGAKFNGAYRYGPYGDGGTEGWSTAQPVTSYEPWGGYIVYNTTAQSQDLEIKPAGLPKAIAKSEQEPIDGWLLRLIVTGDKYFDDGNVIGRLTGASDGLDRYDHPELPVIDGFVSLTINRDDWQDEVTRTRDIRSTNEQNGAWELSLSSKGDGGAVVWDYMLEGQIPQAIAMLDLSNRNIYYLTDGVVPENTQIAREEFPIQLRIFAGSNEYVDKALKDAVAAMPADFTLSQNYPNPFNPTTTIEYALPRPAKVSLVIYNLLGQEVVRLVDDWRDMGIHAVKWSGRDTFGRSVSSGIYFAILHHEGKLLARKMVYIK